MHANAHPPLAKQLESQIASIFKVGKAEVAHWRETGEDRWLRLAYNRLGNLHGLEMAGSYLKQPDLRHTAKSYHEKLSKLVGAAEDSIRAIRPNASGDPYWMTARFPGKDSKGRPVRKGDKVFYYPRTRTMLTGEEAERASREFDAAVFDEGY